MIKGKLCRNMIYLEVENIVCLLLIFLILSVIDNLDFDTNMNNIKLINNQEKSM